VDETERRGPLAKKGARTVRWVFAGLASAATLFLVGAGFSVAVPLVAPGIQSQYADNPALFRPWSEWTSTYMMLHPIGYGFVFAAVFLCLRRWTAFPRGARGGLLYGTGVFVVGALPVYLLSYAAFRVSPEVMLCWVVQSLSQYALAGVVLGRVAAGVNVEPNDG
jgi:hypothetical protein